MVKGLEVFREHLWNPAQAPGASKDILLATWPLSLFHFRWILG